MFKDHFLPPPCETLTLRFATLSSLYSTGKRLVFRLCVFCQHVSTEIGADATSPRVDPFVIAQPKTSRTNGAAAASC
jgi:hypothetical protein